MSSFEQDGSENPEAIDTVAVTASTSARRRWLRTSAVVAMLGAGALGSWTLSQPSSSSAAEEAATEAGDAAPADAPGRHHGHGRHGGRGPGLEAAAETLGMTTDELRTALRDGATLADIAADKGVAVDDLVAAMVAEAEARLAEKVAAGDMDQARADEISANLTERITAMVNGEMPQGGPGRGGPGGHHGPGGGHGRGMHLDTAAEVLGLERAALISELRAGKTLAEIAEAQGVEVDALIDALVEDARTRITDMVNGVEPTADDAVETETAA